MSYVASYFSFRSVFTVLICRYLSKQHRQNIVLLEQQVVAICIAPRDAFILNSATSFIRLAWILTVFEMLMAAKCVREGITRITVPSLVSSGTDVPGHVTIQSCNCCPVEQFLHWDPSFCAAGERV
jgi:hypothetical protein